MVNFRSMGNDGAGGAGRMAHEAKRTDDLRGSVRHRFARETATIGFADRLIEVDLINLSGGGAMIEADISPGMWDRIDLYLGTGNPIECAVRWLRNGRIGLEFAHETQLDCPPEERDAILREVIRRNFPDAIPASAYARPASDARRGDRRHPLIWNGVIVWQEDKRTVRLRNISASGVLIDSQVDFPEGADVTLDLAQSGQYPATVGWSRSGQAGLVFKTPFMLSALAAKRPEVAAPGWKRPAHLERNSDHPSPWATEWHRRDLSDLGIDLAG